MDTNGEANERKRSVETGAEEGRRTRLRSNIISPTPVSSSAVATSTEHPSTVVQGNQPAQAQSNTNEEATAEKSIGALVQELLILDEETVKSALDALVDMELSKSKKEVREVRKELVGVGGCLAIVRSMRHHSNSIDIQSQGSRLLARIAAYDVDNATFISEIGGVEVILKAMKKFPNSENIQFTGSAALTNLSLAPVDRNKIIGQYQENAITVMITAMQAHLNNRKIQSHVCSFLRTLAFKSSNCKEFIRKNGGLSTVAKAYETHVELKERVELTISALF